MAGHAYEHLGATYVQFRRPDPRIERQLHRWLGDARTVVNVGAGTGSYEPNGVTVVAVEPSPTMISQRGSGAAPVVRATADRLPFADLRFDAAMAILTVHHWQRPAVGLAELRRVTRGPVVVLTFDSRVHDRQWIVTEYLPVMTELDRALPCPETICELLGGGVVETVPVPRDCVDGFCHAWWARPEAYLDPAVRAGISGIARLPTDYVEAAMEKLAGDLASGEWHRRHAHEMEEPAIDAGYRIVVGTPSG